MLEPVLEQLRGGLIVSCQAPSDSPLCDPYIISAMALAAEQNGAVGVRINSPSHIAATRLRVRVPIIGIEKMVTEGSDVYITPTFEVAARVAEAGCDIVAIDATRRPRPNGEKLEDLLARIHAELGKAVMADAATYDEAAHAANCGAEIIATTLRGYTAATRGAQIPDFGLIERMAKLNARVVCEGGVSAPADVRRALDSGAFAVVVGTAITGLGPLVQSFVAATR